MKTSYFFAAILAVSLIGALVASRSIKTIMLLVCAALAGWELFRMLG